MKNKGENIDFKSVFKEKIDNVEYHYDPSSWKQFKKNIPGTGKFPYSIAAMILLGVIIVGVSTYILMKPDSITEDIIKDDSSLVVETTENSIVYGDDLDMNKEIAVEETIIADDKVVALKEKDHFADNVEKECIDKHDEKEEIAYNKTEATELITVEKTTEERIPSAKFCISSLAGCEPHFVSFTPGEIGDTIIYLWDFGDGYFSNDKKPDHIYANSGNYVVTLTTKYYRSESINTFTSEKKITIHPKPDAFFEWSNENDNSFRFEVVNTGYENYFWEIDNRVYNSENVLFDFENEGKYFVKLTVGNKFNCKDTVVRDISVEFDVRVHMPDGFTPDGDGRNDLFGVYTNADNIEVFYFNIYNGAGQLVYTSDNINNKWNGIIMNSNTEADANIYFWEYYLKTTSGKIKEDKGKVTLIRK